MTTIKQLAKQLLAFILANPGATMAEGIAAITDPLTQQEAVTLLSEFGGVIVAVGMVDPPVRWEGIRDRAVELGGPTAAAFLTVVLPILQRRRAVQEIAKRLRSLEVQNRLAELEATLAELDRFTPPNLDVQKAIDRGRNSIQAELDSLARLLE